MREHPNYRDEREEINLFFSGKHVLSISDVSRFTGMSRKSVRDKLGITGDITAVGLAKILCGIDGRAKI